MTDVAILSKVRRYEPGCRVSVAMGHFGGGAIPAVEELIRIADLGCRVRIVYMYMTEGAPLNDLLRSHPQVHIRGLWDGSGGHYPLSVHSKYIVIHGNYDGRPHSDVVRAGSPNWTLGSQRTNDEVEVVVRHHRVGMAYARNFAAMWRRAARCIDPPSDDLRVCRERRAWDS